MGIKMKKYTILIDRTCYTSAEVFIMAENGEDALARAYEMADGIDFESQKEHLKGDTEYDANIVDGDEDD
jgi:hypothetical protein